MLKGLASDQVLAKHSKPRQTIPPNCEVANEQTAEQVAVHMVHASMTRSCFKSLKLLSCSNSHVSLSHKAKKKKTQINICFTHSGRSFTAATPPTLKHAGLMETKETKTNHESGQLLHSFCILRIRFDAFCYSWWPLVRQVDINTSFTSSALLRIVHSHVRSSPRGGLGKGDPSEITGQVNCSSAQL